MKNPQANDCEKETQSNCAPNVGDSADNSAKNKGHKILNIVKKLCSRWFIQAFSGMAQGLFVTLIAGP